MGGDWDLHSCRSGHNTCPLDSSGPAVDGSGGPSWTPDQRRDLRRWPLPHSGAGLWQRRCQGGGWSGGG